MPIHELKNLLDIIREAQLRNHNYQEPVSDDLEIAKVMTWK